MTTIARSRRRIAARPRRWSCAGPDGAYSNPVCSHRLKHRSSPSSLPGAEVTFVAEKAGPVTDESGFLTVTARASFDDLPNPDILLVGGGTITGTLVPHHPIVSWIARAHPKTTWTTSVCTGALLLAGAGVLPGVDATTHWAMMGELESLGAVPVRERVVQAAKD